MAAAIACFIPCIAEALSPACPSTGQLLNRTRTSVRRSVAAHVSKYVEAQRLFAYDKLRCTAQRGTAPAQRLRSLYGLLLKAVADSAKTEHWPVTNTLPVMTFMMQTNGVEYAIHATVALLRWHCKRGAKTQRANSIRIRGTARGWDLCDLPRRLWGDVSVSHMQGDVGGTRQVMLWEPLTVLSFSFRF